MKKFPFRVLSVKGGAALLFCAAVIACGFFVSPSVQPAAVSGQKPVYSVEREDPTIALSFDASWGAEHTDEILATLDRYGVKTTFFLVDLWMDEYPDKVKAIDGGGHEIGLHSATHPHFTALSEEQMIEELNKNRETVKKLTGKEAALFRPPYGDYNDSVIRTVSSAGLTAVQWSVDSLDWKGLSAEEISGRILKGVSPGAIVLLHNNGDHTAEALKIFLPALLEEGYRIVPVGELLPGGDGYVDANGVMHQNKE